MLSHYTKRAGCRPVRWTLAVPYTGGSVLPSGMLRESLLSRVTRLWTRLRLAAVGKGVLVP